MRTVLFVMDLEGIEVVVAALLILGATLMADALLRTAADAAPRHGEN